MELRSNSATKCKMHVVIYFLIGRKEGSPFIHPHIYDNKHVTTAKARESILPLTSLLFNLRKKFLIHFVILPIVIIFEILNALFQISNWLRTCIGLMS